ncbi:MAG TPA: ATP-grasp domain-containing protein [Gemmatimonadaceae bacterium]|nr:ATP-grasp domain-containing protein [Gemmatimonadaceae bacterium]
MKIVLLYTREAAEAPADPVLGQLSDALARIGHQVEPIEVDKRVEPLVTGLGRAQPDLVVNIAESFAGKSALESNVAALLNLMGLRYTGSSPSGLMLAGDKILAKKMLAFHGIRTPRFATVYRGALDWAENLHFPVIVKPPQEDASVGLTSASVVHDLKQLLEQMHAMQSEFSQPVLVEEFVDGREFYVGVLGNVNATALPVIEMDFSKFPADRPRMASWDAKWGDDSGGGAEFEGTSSIFPEELPEDLLERLNAAAVDAFHALRLRDYGRIDLRVNDAGEAFVIEVNPNCYLERESEFARAAARGGLEYDALVERIIELAMARYAR